MVAHDLPSTWGTEKGEQQQKYPINLKAFSSGNGIFHSLSYNSEIQRVCSMTPSFNPFAMFWEFDTSVFWSSDLFTCEAIFSSEGGK